MNYEAVKKEAEAAKRVNDLRNELRRLETEKSLFLEEREKEANEILSGVYREIENAQKLLTSQTDKIAKLGKETDEKYETFLGSLASLLALSEKIAKSADNAFGTLQKTETLYRERMKQVDALLAETSIFEKQLKKREKEVAIKNKDADQKLQKAEDLAYWHKTGQRHTTK